MRNITNRGRKVCSALETMNNRVRVECWMLRFAGEWGALRKGMTGIEGRKPGPWQVTLHWTIARQQRATLLDQFSERTMQALSKGQGYYPGGPSKSRGLNIQK